MIYRKPDKYFNNPEKNLTCRGKTLVGIRKETPEKRGWGGTQGDFMAEPRLGQLTPTGYTEGTQ